MIEYFSPLLRGGDTYMSTLTIVLLVVLAIIIVAFIVLMIWGNKMQKKAEKSQAEIRAGAQATSILVIDKKRMRITQAGLPQVVIDQTPKYLRRSKVPIVKAKIGPKVMSLICDEKVFDLIPVKKEIKAVMNGIYIIDVKGLRSGLQAKAKKQNVFKKMMNKVKKSN
jgi:hypothetical protein